MEFNVRRMVSDAGTLITRAVQMSSGERPPESTEGGEDGAEMAEMVERVEVTRRRSEGLVHHVQALLQPNPNIRMEEFLLGKLDRKAPARPTALEQLGQAMTEAANDLGPATAYGRALLRCGETEQRLGLAQRDFARAASATFLRPLQSFLDSDCRAIARERSRLETARAALALALRRSASAATAHDAARAEQHEAAARDEFRRQSRDVTRLLEGVDNAHAEQLQGLQDLVEAQAALFAVGHRYLAGLQRQLHSVTASFQMSGQSPEATEHDAVGLPAPPGAVARSGGDE
ncbi:unnamed protein product [Lampetra planeri]